MEKTTLYLPRDLHQALKEASKQEGKSQAEIVREALTLYLAHRKRPALRSLGVGEDEALTGRESEAWLRKAWGEG
ncbi:hypothetical protein TJA_20250 [Thermus sp. LT1-2-5]|uniref:ribbon-helix-helix domain-containing protein n=1 Tax=Thermus sp. LT1-2-5 TaxID=3026935 RepID=UPI0030E83B0C